MRTVLPRLAAVCLLLAVPVALGGCVASKKAFADVFWSGRTILYEEYLTQDQDRDPPPTVNEVIHYLGNPAEIYDRNGIRRRVEYNAIGLEDRLMRAEFHFDDTEHLIKKELW